MKVNKEDQDSKIQDWLLEYDEQDISVNHVKLWQL